ncbi:MAG: arsenate reductase ArsC [Porticoccus sp.]|nr:arsenate reductase ArsC [Porticoccus sp.]MBQ0808205.1 arsenate reductase ArsC [Porticoccus sp.]
MKNILFVCVENSCRSQLAEAFGHIHKSNDVAVYSAGSKPSGQVNLKAVVTMAELEYDMRGHHSQSLDEMPAIDYDAVITMGCGDNCPWVKGRIREDWGLPDPKHLSEDEFRVIRDEIEKRVIDLLRRID